MATLQELDMELSALEVNLQEVQQQRAAITEARKQLSVLISQQTGQEVPVQMVVTEVPILVGIAQQISGTPWLLGGGALIAAYFVWKGRK